MRAVGVFGGTFDPVHNAHLRVADEVRQQLEIKDFRLVPAADPPHRDYTHANAHHRLAMLKLRAGVGTVDDLTLTALSDDPYGDLDGQGDPGVQGTEREERVEESCDSWARSA